LETVETDSVNDFGHLNASYPNVWQSLINATILPDGTVLITGDGANSDPGDVAHAALPTELWSPTSLACTTMAAMNAPRLYHSEAVLLPLAFTVSGDNLTVTAPANSFLAPPGNYLLFILNAQGVPSVAATVHF
jgi:hypothetical protein